MTMNSLTPPDHLVEQAFVLLRAESGYLSEWRPSAVTASHILNYARGAFLANQAQVEHAIANDLRWRQLYSKALKTGRFSYAPKVAAASDGQLSERQGDGYSLRWRSSRAEAGQVYLMLSVDAEQEYEGGSELVLHVLTEHQAARCSFPALHDGRSQVVIESQDLLLALLTNKDAELFLR